MKIVVYTKLPGSKLSTEEIFERIKAALGPEIDVVIVEAANLDGQPSEVATA